MRERGVFCANLNEKVSNGHELATIENPVMPKSLEGSGFDFLNVRDAEEP
jgi:hypothetical protein